MLFLPLCFLECLAGVAAVEPAAGASAVITVADFGMSAAIAAVAIPADSNAEAINLIMGTPAVVLSSETKNTPDQASWYEMKIISSWF